MNMMTLLNTPERLKRVEEFEARIGFTSDGGPAKISIKCSEQVLVTVSFIKKLNVKSYELLEIYGSGCVYKMPQAFTSMFRQALLEGTAFFVGEKDMEGVEDFIQVEVEEAVGLTDDDLIIIEKPGWS